MKTTAAVSYKVHVDFEIQILGSAVDLLHTYPYAHRGVATAHGFLKLLVEQSEMDSKWMIDECCLLVDARERRAHWMCALLVNVTMCCHFDGNFKLQHERPRDPTTHRTFCMRPRLNLSPKQLCSSCETSTEGSKHAEISPDVLCDSWTGGEVHRTG